MTVFLTIDGSQGEGGGQILRSSLALSIITGTPIHIENIRARRRRPGLMRQHLTAVLAAAEVCQGHLEGAAVRSRELWFQPDAVRAGKYCFSVGTAGSTCLVFQTVLPALLMAEQPSRVTFEGGTHNPMSPPYDFLAQCFVPVLTRMGASVTLELERPGFYPAGGGRFTAVIAPWQEKRRIEMIESGAIRKRRARALVAQLDVGIARRELRVVRSELGWKERECSVEVIDNSAGPGNVLFCHIERKQVSEVVTAFGEKGLRAERVGKKAATAVRTYVDADVPVGAHLADQLLLPMALAGGGRYRTLPLSQHAETNRDIIRKFLDLDITVETKKETAAVSIAER